ncbi:hypothetical protein D3C72_2463650 [compost metagenome]
MEVFSDSFIKVAVFRARGRRVGFQVFAELSYANGHARIAVNGSFVAKKTFL